MRRGSRRGVQRCTLAASVLLFASGLALVLLVGTVVAAIDNAAGITYMCPSGSSNSGDGDSYGGGGSGSGTPSWSGAGEGDRAPAPFAVLSSYQTGTVKTNLVNGSYSVQQSCTVEIRSDGLGGTKALQAVNGTAATTPLYISLFWATMNTECQFDYLWVYSGYNTSTSIAIGAFTGGDYLPEPIAVTSVSVSLTFFSDMFQTFSGFNLTFVISACPFDCYAGSNQGTCKANGTCTCLPGYTGQYCEDAICLDGCSGNGACENNATYQGCLCYEGYKGNDCSIPANLPRWQSILPSSPVPANSVDAFYSPELDQLFYFGGATNDPTAPLNSVLSFDFGTSAWSILPTRTAPPPARFGHCSAVVDGERFFILGGRTPLGDLNDLWVYNIAALNWTEIVTNDPDQTSQPEPSYFSGCAYAPDLRSIIVYGGLTGNNYDTNRVFLFDVDNGTWQYQFGLRNQILAPPDALFGASVVYDASTNRVIVYGGIFYNPLEQLVFNSLVYVYSLVSGMWSIPFPSGTIPLPRFLHSAVVIGNHMVVFGGQEDAPLSDVSTCFSNHIYVYHLTCNYWSDMPFPISHNESSHARYAHSMVVRDNLIYVLGGFTGISRSDFLVFAHDRCSWITSSASCTAVAYCSWSPDASACIEVASATQPQGIDPTVNMTTLLLANSSCSVCAGAYTQSECVSFGAACFWCSISNTCYDTTTNNIDSAFVSNCTLQLSNAACSLPIANTSVQQFDVCTNCFSAGSNCSYCSNSQTCVASGQAIHGCLAQSSEMASCADTCRQYSSCSSCTVQGGEACGWCPISKVCQTNKQICISEGSSPLAPGECPTVCSEYTSGKPCLLSTSNCVWCQSLGQCSSARVFPMSYPFGECNGYGYAEALQTPITCECNGHSKSCSNSLVCENCGNNTENGPLQQCDLCLPGFTGSAIDSGVCWYELPDSVSSVFMSTVAGGTFTYMRTGIVASSGTVEFASVSSELAIMYLSIYSETPGPSSYGWVIMSPTTTLALDSSIAGKEVFMGVSTSAESAQYTVTFYTDGQPDDSLEGISLLFYLIIFFMCFFGVLFVGIFMLKIRQYYRVRGVILYRPTFDLSIMAQLTRVRLVLSTGPVNPDKTVVSFEKIADTAFVVATSIVELPHDDVDVNDDDYGEDFSFLALGCAVLVDKADMRVHPDISAGVFFNHLDEAHARRIQMPDPSELAQRQPPPQRAPPQPAHRQPQQQPHQRRQQQLQQHQLEMQNLQNEVRFFHLA